MTTFKLTTDNSTNQIAVEIASQVTLGNEKISVLVRGDSEKFDCDLDDLLKPQGLKAVGYGYFGNHPNTFLQFSIRSR